jgi:hypothetical protein
MANMTTKNVPGGGKRTETKITDRGDSVPAPKETAERQLDKAPSTQRDESSIERPQVTHTPGS